MIGYQGLIKPFLFRLKPEKAHYFTLSLLRNTLRIPGMKSLFTSAFRVDSPKLHRKVFGIDFPNPVGLAAGFDKNAAYMHELQYLGFGFIEVGTVTPVGQEGNPQPRLFRLPKDEALINRMGFNNAGLEPMLEFLKNRPKNLIVGGNIGKNKITPNEKAGEDYAKCFEALHPYVDYFTVNVSSPNTPNLRALQEKEPLKALLSDLKARNQEKEIQRPILLKIAPDLNHSQLDDIIEIVQETKIDGVIATNTTLDRSHLNSSEAELGSIGAGGLSGKPAREKSTEVISYLSKHSNKSFPIVGVGGIHSAQDALEKLEAGADLVQVYTGFIYEGPSLIKRINKALLNA